MTEPIISRQAERGQRVVAARQALGWRQVDLASRVLLSLGTIRSIERGRTTPHRATLRVLEKALGLDEGALDLEEGSL